MGLRIETRTSARRERREGLPHGDAGEAGSGTLADDGPAAVAEARPQMRPVSRWAGPPVGMAGTPGPQAVPPKTPDTRNGRARRVRAPLLGDVPLEAVARARTHVGTAGHAAARRGARHRLDRLDRPARHGGLPGPGA